MLGVFSFGENYIIIMEIITLSFYDGEGVNVSPEQFDSLPLKFVFFWLFCTRIEGVVVQRK